MITISKSGNAVKFTFDENDHYLQNGTIEVPVNSLALIMDDSDMVTFRKSASNDIFVSANYSEFGMSKAELEAWYKTYMVGSSGGGGGTGGTTPEEVQSMIDSSLTDYYDKNDSDGRFQPKGDYATSGDIESAVSGLAESSAVTLEIAEATSGKADSSSLATVATSGSYDDLLNKPTIPSLDGYATEQWVSGFTYGKTTTDELLAEKLDASAYTPTDLSEYWTSAQTESAIEASLSGKVDTDTYTAYTAATDSTLSNKADKSEIPSVSGYADSVKYNSTSKYVEFYHGGTGGTKVFEYDASPFLIDGMVQNVEIKDVTSGSSTVTCLVISFNTDAGKQDINIPISEIFNANNYYTKSETDSAITAATNGLAVATAVTQEISEAVSGKQDTFENEDVLSGITSTDITNWNGKSDFSGSYNDLTDKPTIPTVPTSNTAFTNDAGYITSDALSGYAESSAVTEEITAAVSGKADTNTVTALTSTLTAHTADTTIHVTSNDKSTWSGKQDALVSGTNIKTINNESILGSGNITIQGGGGSGSPTVELTQAEYDALVSAGTVSADTYYIITDAQAGDLTQYWTSAQTQSAITQATSGKADSSDVYTKSEVDTAITAAVSGKVETSAITSAVTSASTDNEIPTAKAVWDVASQGGGGGGTTYSAGTNIDITNDTISCTLPISAGTNSSGKGIIVGDNECSASGLYGVAIGHNADANLKYSFVMGSNSYSDYNNGYSFTFGDGCKNEGQYSFMFGRGSNSSKTTKSYQFYFGNQLHFNNDYEVSFGTFNNSVSGSSTFGNSGNTIFTIGNGYDFSSTHNWHNALEIRQNGDIYVPNTNDTSITGNYAYSLYPMLKLQDYLQIKVVKLTQQEYDALATKDNNTLYFIGDSTNGYTMKLGSANVN